MFLFRRINLLTLLFVFSFFSGFCQSQKFIEIDKIYSLAGTFTGQFFDTTKLNAITDSIAKEGNIEKTEYPKLFVFLQKRSALKADSLEIYFENYAPVVASFKTPGVKSLFKFYFGQAYFDEQKYLQGMDLMLEAVSEFKNIGYGNIPTVDIPLYQLCNYYYQFNNYRKSIEYGLLADKYQTKSLTIGTNNTLGLAYQKLGLYDSAIYRFKKTIAVAQRNNSVVWYSIATGNLGRTYCLNNDFSKGIPLLITDVKTGMKYEPINSALSATYIAEAFIAQKQVDSAGYYLRLSRKIVDDANTWNSVNFFLNKYCFYYYQKMADLCQLTGNYREAYNNLDTVNINKEKYNQRFNLQFLTSAEKQVAALEYQQNLNLLAEQEKNERLQKIILIIVIIAVLMIAIVLRRSQNIKAKKEKQLAAEKEANLILKKENAEQQLENAKQQLNELLKKFEERIELTEQFEAGLEKVTNSKNGILSNEQTGKILKDLSAASLLTNEDWQLFQQRFEKVYPDFFYQLAQQVQDITPAEERMLALMKLKVTYRRMSQILGISPESVRTAKYRLRKKLIACNQTELLEQLELS